MGRARSNLRREKWWRGIATLPATADFSGSSVVPYFGLAAIKVATLPALKESHASR